MPYIVAAERPALDVRVEALADELVASLKGRDNRETEVSVLYRRTFVSVAQTLLRLQEGDAGAPKDLAETLAVEVFGTTGKPGGVQSSWLGRFNYSLTRLVQLVPQKMVEGSLWKEEFRYWVYAQTGGALERAAMEMHATGGDGWAADGVVGVLADVKDEYKRRVSTAYEAIQIKKSGDCYTTPYRTELSEVRDSAGSVVGYQEVMKDFRD